MILTCPSCGTRYQTESARIAPPGCNVRCAKCLHTWFHEVSADDEDAEAGPEAIAASLTRSLSEPTTQDDGSEVGSRGPGIAGAVRPSIGAGALLGWAALFLFVTGFVWSVISYRQPIAEMWPQSTSLYALLGMPVNVRGLALADVQYNQGLEDGQPVLQISGRVVNITDRELPVPEIRVSLSDIERRELYGWSFDTGVTTLQPGESNPFVTRLNSPPPDARSVNVRFMDDGTEQ